MRRLILALPVTLVMTWATSLGALGDVSGTPVALSCNDGHSVMLFADSATLTSLTADVQSINTSGTGLVCTIDTPTLDPSAESAEWTVYDVTPGGGGIHPRSGPNSMPATTMNGTTSFDFIPGTFTALLVTTSYPADLSQKTLTDELMWRGTGTYAYRDGSTCGSPPTVRFYFESPSASGPSTGSPPAGFYTQFWWSNPQSLDLNAFTGGTLRQSMNFDLSVHQWSDWNGKFNDDPAVTEGFIDATQHVQMIGLSFGGGCFFENGVTNANQSEFDSTFSAS